MWGDPGVTELLQLAENSISVPSVAGGQNSITMSRAGILKRMRFRMVTNVDVTGFTTAPGKSAYGPLAAINNIAVKANGSIDLFNMSGFGMTVYNEVENRDGSILDHPVTIAAFNVADAIEQTSYAAIGAAGNFTAAMPFEVQFSLPMNIRGLNQEIGLWILQNQAIDVNCKVQFNPQWQLAAANNAVYSAGTGSTYALNAASQLFIERELYDVPADPKNFPRLDWAHQIIEYSVPWTGNFSRFNLPRSGLLLRAIIINLDTTAGGGAPVEYTDVNSCAWIYGANRTPIQRTGSFITQEYLQDYGRLPSKGVLVLDFYKWGFDGLKLVKDTDVLANLRIETKFTATAAGTQLVLLDRLYPVAASAQQ